MPAVATGLPHDCHTDGPPPKEVVLLTTTLLLGVVALVTGRATVLHGVMHLVLLGAPSCSS